MNVRVLLVDDHDSTRSTLERRLRQDSQLELVGTACSVEDAKALLPSRRPDIVLLDIAGHDGHGVDACRALRQLTDIPVIVVASFMTPELWSAVHRAGATDYLLRYVDTERLSREIVRLAGLHRASQRHTPQNHRRASL